MRTPIISLQNVSLTLKGNAGNVNIIKNISLNIDQGESVGLIGPSGSGKSSLLMLAGGLERASSGEIEILGQVITEMSEDRLSKLRRNNVGVVFQSFHLIPTLTALENVATPLEISFSKNPNKHAIMALDRVGLSHRADHYPSQLSGGEQQRVALARAYVSNPKILLADEPTGNLDEENTKAIVDLLFEIKNENDTTLILVTHSRELAKKCDRIIKIRDGKLL
ncbi:ABC transporter ATP-binding protein [Paracoccaceae bacterium]|jgi:putative ABC transport system ATP-binding protein|nr:ABC transporter ATP-binding protein [Paracoccaceae bacterium]MDC3205496.1 ABC transporter ATP-binding protein [Paracoccaceae bacterium]|tara:strand:+ start:631 stop:1299 length:669 start_codon:yes stop_codon:yes gene_type:complete